MNRLFLACCASLCICAAPFVRAQTTPTAVSHRVLVCDKGKAAILRDSAGKLEWQVALPTTAHDVTYLPNGNILMPLNGNTIVEQTPDGKEVFRHVGVAKPPYTGRVEIHAFQRLPKGLTMIAETGNKRIIEVDKNDKIVKETPLTIDKPDAHRDTRMVRKLKNGHYLVCHENDGKVREYEPGTGKVVWTYALDLDGLPETGTHQGHGTHVFGAIRLPSGNTLIACGDGNRVIEVTPEGKEVWRVGTTELPGIHLYWVTTLQLLPNGNIVIGNTHAGPENPQLIEVTHDKAKKVVWTFQNMTDFGNDLCASQILDVRGVVR